MLGTTAASLALIAKIRKTIEGGQSLLQKTAGTNSGSFVRYN